jgi:flagella basal body P-ring formation protein FlgA
MVGKIVLLALMLGAPGAATVGEASGCLALARPVLRGAPITRDMVQPVACRDRASVPLVFDRASGLVLATHDLAAGTYLGRTVVRDVPAIDKGATLTLVSTQGAVRIERPVTALQATRSGRVFVRDGDGQIYAASVAGKRTAP